MLRLEPNRCHFYFRVVTQYLVLALLLSGFNAARHSVGLKLSLLDNVIGFYRNKISKDNYVLTCPTVVFIEPKPYQKPFLQIKTVDIKFYQVFVLTTVFLVTTKR